MRFSQYIVFIVLMALRVSGVNPDPAIPQDAIDNAGNIRVEENFRVRLWAAEPLTQDPVSIYIDEKGRVFSAETERQTNGVEDNRGHGYWLQDDLASQTVEDRSAMLVKWKDRFDGGLDYFRRGDEWIRLIQDTDGDGMADSSTYFARNFNDPLDGTGAGVLFWNGDVYYTNIPHLWRLRDIDDDGIAEERSSMFSGFGVRVALRGHDMHGLVVGPDGKLYWSIGDRGYHVQTKNGQLLHDPGSGAVFRCNFDGSDLEVFYSSLRNPQELAFDKYGNLFTGDNNSDSGDAARLVYCLEGGESGWNMAYQYLDGDYSRGPWNNEKLWHKQFPGQPAWILPPIDHIGNGPSGFTYYPGTGLPAAYSGHFFLCDFRGGAAQSRILTFSLENTGAGFKTVNPRDFVNNVLVTDFDFGFDGKMYLADWVSSWNHNGQGRIYTLEYKNLASNPNILAMKSLVAEGFQHRSEDELASLLSHEDMRVRLRAQLELASRGATSLETFESLLRRGPQIQKIHAIWGLTILARDYQKNRQAYDHHPLSRVIRSASVDDAEIRAQVARAFGEARYVRGAEKVISELLHDENPRVLLFAAMAVGKNGLTQYADRLTSILAENNDQDVFLRHGCVMGFAWLGDTDYLEGLRSHPSTAVRRGALLALRKLKDSNAINSFLKDRDESIVTEAARAIHDVNPAPESTAHLAELARNYSENSLPSGFSGENEALLRRIINANFRIGEVSNAENVLRLIQNDKLSDRIRIEAIRSVGDWIQPGALDRVLGWHRPVPRMTSASDSSGPQVLFNAQLPPLVNSLNKNLSEEIARAMAKLGILMEDDRIISTISNANLPVTQRLSAIQSLKNLDATVWNDGINAALDSDSPELIQAGLASLVETQGARAFPRLRLIFHSENPILKNAATLQIARLETPEAQQFFLNQVVGKLSQGTIDSSIHLEIHEAVSHSQNPEMIHALNTYLDSLEVSPDLREWMVTLHGGNVQRGQSLFESHPVAQCLRCHKVGSTGVGEAGPNLQGVASRLNPVQLIESLILPNATLSQGFGPVSAMPPMGLLLSKHEIRDILAYIKTLN